MPSQMGRKRTIVHMTWNGLCPAALRPCHRRPHCSSPSVHIDVAVAVLVPSMAGRTSIIADINREWGRWICDEPYLESTLASEQGAAQSISVEAEYLAPPHTIEHTQGRGHVATIDRGQNRCQG